MPAKSKKQQQAMAIAEHEPGKLYARNKGLLKMSHEQLHDFAATKTKGLPKVADHTKHGHPPHEVKGHHKIAKPGKQVSGGPGKIKDGHPSAMYDQRVTHDGLHAAGHTKRHTFHGIRHKDHHSKLSEG